MKILSIRSFLLLIEDSSTDQCGSARFLPIFSYIQVPKPFYSFFSNRNRLPIAVGMIGWKRNGRQRSATYLQACSRCPVGIVLYQKKIDNSEVSLQFSNLNFLLLQTALNLTDWPSRWWLALRTKQISLKRFQHGDSNGKSNGELSSLFVLISGE